MSDFISKNFKTVFIGVMCLFAFAILVQGCNKPSRVWNWNRTRIFNRGDGNWFDWRSRNKKERDDGTEIDEDTGERRRRWNLFRDDGLQTGENEQPIQKKGEGMNDTVLLLLVVGGGLAAIWFLVLTPEQRDNINPFKKKEGGGEPARSEPSTVLAAPVQKIEQPEGIREDLFHAYCLLFDNIEDQAAKTALNDHVLSKVMTIDQPKPEKTVKKRSTSSRSSSK